jgi:hypothetical protein
MDLNFSHPGLKIAWWGKRFNGFNEGRRGGMD